jgi:hypothetical protein
MKKIIQIIEVSTGNIHTEIKTLEQLISLLKSELFGEDFQRRDAVEKLLVSNKDTALSMNCVWRAKLIINNKNERKSTKKV